MGHKPRVTLVITLRCHVRKGDDLCSDWTFFHVVLLAQREVTQTKHFQEKHYSVSYYNPFFFP